MDDVEHNVSDNYRTAASNNVEDPKKPAPSPVVHIRGLASSADESQVMEALQEFGTVRHVVMMPHRRQALVEFERLEDARACVAGTAGDPVYVGGQPAYCNFSTSQRISRKGGTPADDVARTNHILLLTVNNALYPITTEVIHTICSPYGVVQRIVIFKKNGVQALVEFDSIPSAQQAKSSLNGADIYSGCCTLKIEYAKPARLNVYRNDSETWDYTLEGPCVPNGQQKKQPALLGDHPSTMRGYGNQQGTYCPQNYSFNNYTSGSPGSPYNHTAEARLGFGNARPTTPMSGPGTCAPHNNPCPMGGSAANRVMMVYNMNPSVMNCSRLFNLVCLYGNVEKIKFLKSKPGVGMIQMADAASVDRAVANLNTAQLFGQKLSLSVSKQQEIVAGQAFELEDGSDSFRDFVGSRHNRFSTHEQASKNRILPPSAILHFYSAPPEFSEQAFIQICEETGVKKPNAFKLFSSKSERTSSGLAEWDNKNDATEVVAVVNHHQLKNPNGFFAYTLKLCFSSAQQVA
ncbi:heterogeneous nuclear ribonucleoprotein L-like isoform X3 [Petromyzon marinus]|uniref:Heterogeneous nuclear ribonucleoprotein L-like isoform X3 n=1 Tax=Petromyzon marinus TaxID=7757 RepID=A0AAJ7T5N3_PETMA|nr:heterogeneous nuclear ribonucleoprotein L-like isoform X3 [Petromyzon marinus]